MPKIITDNTRLPNGTEVNVLLYSKVIDEYYVKNVESDYCCWVKKEDLDVRPEDIPVRIRSERPSLRVRIYKGLRRFWNRS